MQSDQNQQNSQVYEGRWSNYEHLKFLEGIMVHGKDWKIIETIVKTRNGSQVRSHAQKFFIKLSKINKERRKGKNKDLGDPTEIQNEILNNFTEQNITTNTPHELINLLKKDWSITVNLNNNSKSQRKIRRRSQISRLGISTGVNQNQMKKQNVNRQLSWLNNYQNDSHQESFLIRILETMGLKSDNIQSFIRNQQFGNLIDGFGSWQKHKKLPHQNIAQQMTQLHEVSQSHDESRGRRMSFALPDSEEDDDKLKETINNLRKGHHN